MSILYRNAEKHDDANENTVVIRLSLGSRRILLAGDAEGGAKWHHQSAIARFDRSGASREISRRTESRCSRCGASRESHIFPHGISQCGSGQDIPYLVRTIPLQEGRLPDADVVTKLGRRDTVWSTATDGENCGEIEAKIGPDTDESRGGCNNILVTVGADGALNTAYNKIAG